jgi:hypothetical protein
VGILNAVKTLPETSRVGLITFASAISVYELGLPEVASAEVFPGTPLPLVVFISLLLVSCVRIPHVAHLTAVIDLFPPKGEASLSNSDFVSLVERQANFVASLGTCTATIDRILTALVASAPQKRLPIQTRALGTALEIALALVTGTPSVTSPHQLSGGWCGDRHSPTLVCR